MAQKPTKSAPSKADPVKGKSALRESSSGNAPTQPPAAKLVDVTFDLDTKATTAKFVRVYLKNSTDDIASTAKPHGVLTGQAVGSTLKVTMDLTGSSKPTDLGQFTVKNAQRSPISLTVADGPISVKTLHVTG